MTQRNSIWRYWRSDLWLPILFGWLYAAPTLEKFFRSIAAAIALYISIGILQGLQDWGVEKWKTRRAVV